MAENLVTIPAISATFNVVLDTVVKEFMSYVRSKANVDPCVLHLKLRTTRLALSAVLNDAMDRHITNLAVLEWLEELTSVIYDAEDVEDVIQTEALQLKINAESQMSAVYNMGDDQLPNRNSFSSYSFTDGHFLVAKWRTMISSTSSAVGLKHDPIVDRLLNLCDRLDVFLPQVSVLGLGESLKIAKNKIHHLPLSSARLMNSGNNIVGRESEKEEIMSFLEEPNNKTGVHLVVISGLAGVGKTTFARMVYDDPRLKGAFDVKSWVSVSTAMGSDWVIKEILESITHTDAPNGHLESLEAILSRVLLGKKLLLVLDDVEDVEEKSWDDLRRPLEAGPEGVTIVIVTRDDHAIMKKNIPVNLVLHLNPLSDADCWSLLKDVAFGEEVIIDQVLEETGNQIAQRCKGLPLAARILGGILRFTRDVEDWDSILRSKVWHLMSGPNDIHPALRLSYSYLPSHLKKCFSYCSIFSKKYEFDRERLILLWIAEGFVQVSKSDTLLEEVGSSYFQELFSRSLFQKSSSRRSHFRMHDMVHDLAQNVSSDICFMLKPDNPQVCPSKIRHFSYIQTKHDNFEYFKAIDGHVHFGNLRTFLPLKSPPINLCRLDNEQAQSFFQRFISLRVLSLSHYNIYEIPQSFSCLKHLRFLDLSRTSVKNIPPLVCDMYNLQILLLQKCPYLTKLPERVGNLVALRHLDISGCNRLQELPVEINKLNKVHTLTNFVVGRDSGAKLAVLANFHNLRGQLCISGLQHVVSELDASNANMKTKMHLDELTLEWGGQTQTPRKEEHVCHLLKPGPNLKKITISSYGGQKLANWIGAAAFCDIVYVCLTSCYQCSCLPSLGQLPSLKKLHIIDFPKLVTVGPEFYANVSSSLRPFQALEVLKLEKMPEWKVWSPYRGNGEPFSSLQELCIENCPKLSEHLPKRLPSLLKLEIIKCGQLTSLLPELPSICKLRLQECENFMSISGLITLVSLDIRGASIKNSLASDLHTLIL